MSTSSSISGDINAMAGTPVSSPRLSPAVLVTYSLPAAGIGFMLYLSVLYLFRFATDVLLIAPAAISVIFGISRVVDAVTDPFAGYLSDRTQSRFGRRRPWLIASAIPVALLFTMMWASPSQFTGGVLLAWMSVAIIGFYAALTLVNVPHQSWGAELSPEYHERTRIFGARLLLLNVGAFAAVGCLFLIDQAESLRETVFQLTAGIGILTALSVIWSACRLKERPELQQRGPMAVRSAYRDLLSNPHARLLLLVFFIQSLGNATIGVLTPYMTDYVLGGMSFPLLVATYMVAQTLSVPVWAPLSRIFGKRAVWLGSMLVSAVGFGGFFFLGPGDHLMSYTLAVIVGAAVGCGETIGPSVQSDIVDWDEWRTGERKEGGYFAGFNFAQKTAFGITVMLTGFVLQFAGYVPNVAQTETVQLAIRSLYALFPFTCYLIGAILFLRFSLGEAEHKRIRRDLDKRRR